MAANGTTLKLPSPPSPITPIPESFGGPGHSGHLKHVRLGDESTYSPSPTRPSSFRSDVNALQGQPEHHSRSIQAWNPAALLQPNCRAPSAPVSRNGTPSQPSTPQSFSGSRQDVTSSNNVVFHFPGADESSSQTAFGDASAPSSFGMNGENGVGNMIERMNNVQSRSTVVPQAKRRKVDEGANPQSGTNMPVRSGSGILGDYVKERRNESNGSSASQTLTVDLTDGKDDDVAIVNDPRYEEVCYGMIKTSLNCDKVPSHKPGQQSLWGPGYHPGIKVVLKRQAGDRTVRIPAVDHTREVIGLLDNSSASALAPLLDANICLRTDCRIPPRHKKPGEEPGQEISRAYTLDIVMYGPYRNYKLIGNQLNKFNLKLIAPHMVQKGIRVCNPHNQEYRPPAPRVYSTEGLGGQATSVNRTVEEVRSEVMGVFDSLTRSEDLPGMDPDPCITTPLLKHQRQGLYFMLTREMPHHVHIKEKGMMSIWQTKSSAAGENLNFNVITGHTQRAAPPETRGGILADMMGLGKTLSILSLIASTMDEAQEWDLREPLQRSVPDSRPSRNNIVTAQPDFGITPLARNAKSTLIVCPLSTVSNWEEQMKQHVRPGSLSYHIYHGSGRIKDPAKLATFDIVITTYGSVSNELSSRRKGKDGLYPLEELGWFRIVLDEAHMIREQSTLQFKAICRLEAARRWAVTGTPVQNRLDDLSALLAFIRLHPFHDRGKFARYIVEPFKACDPEVVPKLRILVDTITLRRLKDKIDLPKREDNVVRLDFSPEERNIYDMFARNAQDRVKVLAGSNVSKALGGNTYIHILKAILRLRLLCAHGKDLLNEDDLATLRGMTAEMAIDLDDDDEGSGPALSHQKAHEMFTLMQETNNDACIECSKKLGAQEGSNMDSETQDDVLGYMTPCFHVVCGSCIKTFEERTRSMLAPGQYAGPCPVCHTVVRYEFVELRREDVDAEHDGPAKSKSKMGRKRFERYDGPHTKTKALLEDLLKLKADSEANPFEPPFKSVVFSGWTSHLDLIELALNAARIGFTRLDGTMTRTARTAAMDSFRDDDSVHVILVSIMAGGLGLNLTAGNNVFVMEPQYNPAAEAQAVDRVHRLGQKRPVRTVRFIMRDSFEEKMLELQEKKMKLATLSMDGQNKALEKAEAARQKLMDLRSLFK